jgi:hypothetical protein
MSNSPHNVDNPLSIENLIEKSRMMTAAEIKSEMQQRNASIAHKSSRLRTLRTETEELDREITHALAENEFLRLTLRDRE